MKEIADWLQKRSRAIRSLSHHERLRRDPAAAGDSMRKRRNPFQGLNLPRRASINPLGGETRRVPVSLPKVSIRTLNDDGKRRVTEPSSA
jgi:hypothetical protein